MSKWLKETTLKGETVSLVPLEKGHVGGLIDAANDGALWKLWFTTVPLPEKMDDHVAKALKKEDGQTFTVIRNDTGKVIGSTSYLNADPENRRVEIGATWYSKSSQRSGVNTECKFLLLQHAFETLQCIAVEFRTHWHNRDSRKAIERLGAKQDGVLRNHRVFDDGTMRDTVVYSIIKEEWPTVKKSLRYMMNKHKN